AEGLRLSADIQRELWQHAERAAKEAPTPIVATFVTSLNETIDSEAERLAVGRHRVPGAVWLLLFTVASLACGSSGYFAGAGGALRGRRHRPPAADCRRDHPDLRHRRSEAGSDPGQPAAARRSAGDDASERTLTDRFTP